MLTIEFDFRCTAMDDAESYVRTDDESVLATDDAESYVRTDEEQSISFKTDEEAELHDGNPKVCFLHAH